MFDPREIPIDLQSVPRLFCRPELVGYHRDRAAFHERDFEHLTHAGDGASFLVVNGLHTSAEYGWMSYNCHLHSRKIEIESELLRPIALGPAIKPRHSLAD